MKILILEDEQRNAKRLIRLLNDIDRTFIVEGPLASIKETVEFFQSGKTTDLILADIRLTDGLSSRLLNMPRQPFPSYLPPHTMNMQYRHSSSTVLTIF